MCNDGSAPLACEELQTQQKGKTTTTKEKEGTKRPADKRPEKGLKASPRNPKSHGAKKPTPKNARRTHGRNGRENERQGDKNKKTQTKRNVRGRACDPVNLIFLSSKRQRKRGRGEGETRGRVREQKNKTNANSGDDET